MMIGIITDNLELVIANPVPACLIAKARAKKVMTNRNPSAAPNNSVWNENFAEGLISSNINAIKDATR